MLIWKEWREQRWKLALGCVLLVGFTLIGLRTRVTPDHIVLMLGMLLGGVVPPLIAATDVVAAERSTGVLSNLLGLPIRPWKILAVKLAMAAAMCLVPILAAGLVAWWIAGGREVESWHLWAMCAATAGMAVSVLVWTVAFSIHQPSEARAGMIGLAILIAWLLIVSFYGGFDQRLPKWVMTLLPGSFMLATDRMDVPWLGGAFPVQMAYVVILTIWAFRRFGRLGRVR